MKASKKISKTSTVRNKEKHNNYLKALVDNKSDVETYSVIEEKSDTNVENNLKSISIDCEYVVITTSSLASYFDDFMAWKKQKGVDIELVTVESIYQNYIGDLISGINDNAGKIRQFLYDAYDNGLEYALFGGTSSVLPIRYGWGNTTSTDPGYEIPSDLYFSDFDGDWNVDGDNRYGEPSHDDVDYGAEIFVGRLLCESGSDIQNWTIKLLLYEKNPGNGSTAYLKKAFYTQADQLQQYDQANDIATRFGSIFTTDEIFEEEYNGVPDYDSDESPQFPTGANVINEMNSGYGFVSWFNHGASYGIGVATKGINDCGSNDRKKVTNFDSYTAGWCSYQESGNGLDNLSISSKPFILYTLGCETTPFDSWEGVAPTANPGAKITNQSSKGSPIYLGNTRYGWVTPSWYLQQDFTDIVAGGTYQLGAAEAYSKASYSYHYTSLSHNLIGCPETEMWTEIPSDFTNVSITESGNDVIVSTGGVSGCRICIMSPNDMGSNYFFVRNNASGFTFLNVPKPYQVTITKHNYIPFTEQVLYEEKSAPISGNVSTVPDITVYPNPVSEKIITFNKLEQAFESLKIYDSTGRLIQTINIENESCYKLDISTYLRGIYTFQAEAKELETKTGKFIIE